MQRGLHCAQYRRRVLYCISWIPTALLPLSRHASSPFENLQPPAAQQHVSERAFKVETSGREIALTGRLLVHNDVATIYVLGIDQRVASAMKNIGYY